MRLGNNSNESQPQDPMMGGDPSQMGMGDPMMGGDPNQMGMGDPNQTDPMMGGDPNQMGDGNGSQFDTNFDAGVEADEDTDPKKYIQQLTGKLSQELNKYENGDGKDDSETAKYTGKMILKAAAKFLDEKGRKDLIRAINTCDEPDEEDEDEYSDGSDETEMPDDLENNNMGQEPMMEITLTKRELQESFNDNMDIEYNSERRSKKHRNKKSNSIYRGKIC